MNVNNGGAFVLAELSTRTDFMRGYSFTIIIITVIGNSCPVKLQSLWGMNINTAQLLFIFVSLRDLHPILNMSDGWRWWMAPGSATVLTIVVLWPELSDHCCPGMPQEIEDGLQFGM